MTNVLIQMEQLNKYYRLEGETVQALKGIDLKIGAGEFVTVMGPSGSGKSTLMHIIGLLDSPTAGRHIFEDENVSALTSNQRADIRNRKIGFVFQSFNLLSRSTALENVELPMLYKRPSVAHRREKAMAALKLVGLENRANHRPTQLSGGQQQRVAIARALVNGPRLILADEPTGNLDTRTGKEIIKLLDALFESGITVVLVTHDQEVARATRRRIMIRDGSIEQDENN